MDTENKGPRNNYPTHDVEVSPNLPRIKAITVTLGPSFRKLSINLQLKETGALIYDCLKDIGDFLISPEFHEDGNLHWHLYLFIEDKIKYYKMIHKLELSVGQCLIKNVFDLADWKKYVTKSSVFVSKIFKSKISFKFPWSRMAMKSQMKLWKLGKDAIIRSLDRNIAHQLEQREVRRKARLQVKDPEVGEVLS